MFLWLWFSKVGDRNENRKIVLFAITIAVITLGVDKLIEMMYFRPRPFVLMTLSLLIQKSNARSFISKQSRGRVICIGVHTFLEAKNDWKYSVNIAALMALSRIFIGVHYPLDVTVGAIIAFGVTYVVIWQRHFLDSPFNWVLNIFRKSTSKTNE